ncbi:MAG: undecaprenyldiphospho-muramoylpentapeptide beta-N-acetylglucosaminyltransferase [Polyangia bacterium]|jgi:UDP-N-acetylglucosamine--N-acetylmuramyl-(pentapeptide) pyrophosphoryl-undecaprenol N-acetylglucosamine transferase
MRLLIAGGGTGGHLYPGIAVAEEVVRRGGQALFVGTSRGLEARAVPAAGYPLELLEVSGLKRVGLMAGLRSLFRLPKAFSHSLSILRQFRPDVVLGVGGYASGPMVLAAALWRYPTAIQEQNSVPGMTNRILSRLVRVVMVAFDEARRSFPAGKTETIGNPVRSKLVATLTGAADGEQSAPSRILVVGGSQGARAVNDLVLAAVEMLAKKGALPAIVHQTGPSDEERCRKRYRAVGVADQVDVRPFIDDMATEYHRASLVVARAGALTLAELAIAGRPAILIPLPTAADDHQSKNAARFAQAGAAIVLDQHTSTGAELAQLLGDLLADSARRQAMAAAMLSLARPNAAAEIVDRLERLTS